MTDPAIDRSAIGRLLYLTNQTRRDISYATNHLASYCVWPTEITGEDYQAVHSVRDVGAGLIGQPDVAVYGQAVDRRRGRDATSALS